MKHSKEGTESSAFWFALGGKQNYASKKVTPEVFRDPHLFAFSFNKGWTLLTMCVSRQHGFLFNIQIWNCLLMIFLLCDHFRKIWGMFLKTQSFAVLKLKSHLIGILYTGWGNLQLFTRWSIDRRHFNTWYTCWSVHLGWSVSRA